MSAVVTRTKAELVEAIQKLVQQAGDNVSLAAGRLLTVRATKDQLVAQYQEVLSLVSASQTSESSKPVNGGGAGCNLQEALKAAGIQPPAAHESKAANAIKNVAKSAQESSRRTKLIAMVPKLRYILSHVAGDARSRLARDGLDLDIYPHNKKEAEALDTQQLELFFTELEEMCVSYADSPRVAEAEKLASVLIDARKNGGLADALAELSDQQAEDVTNVSKLNWSSATDEIMDKFSQATVQKLLASLEAAKAERLQAARKRLREQAQKPGSKAAPLGPQPTTQTQPTALPTVPTTKPEGEEAMGNQIPSGSPAAPNKPQPVDIQDLLVAQGRAADAQHREVLGALNQVGAEIQTLVRVLVNQAGQQPAAEPPAAPTKPIENPKPATTQGWRSWGGLVKPIVWALVLFGAIVIAFVIGRVFVSTTTPVEQAPAAVEKPSEPVEIPFEPLRIGKRGAK